MDRKLRYQYLAKLISLIALVLRLLNPPSGFVYSVGVPFEAIHFIYLFVLFLITIISLTSWRTPWETSPPWGLYRPVVFVCYFFRGEGGGVKLKPRNKGQLFDGGPSVRSHWSPFFAEWDRDRSVIKMHHLLSAIKRVIYWWSFFQHVYRNHKLLRLESVWDACVKLNVLMTHCKTKRIAFV